ncbi:MAG: ATP-binding protein [Bacteroidia bacterium]|nr:ATP-binding protein [Bacteroidia bacterium]
MFDPIAILLIDDDEEDYLLTRDVIEQINHQRYTVDWVDTYARAREVIRMRVHDVYLVDYRLGPDSGLELIRESVEAGVDAPMILLTGMSSLEVDNQASQAGAADFLVKSQLSADQLERSVRYSLKHTHNLREIRSLNSELEIRVEQRTEALRKAVEDLRQSQQLFDSIASHFPNGVIMVLDRGYRFVIANGSELRNFGWKIGTIPGARMLDFFSPEQYPALEYFLERVLEGESLTFEFTIQDQILNFRGVPLPDIHGAVTQILIVANNITRQKKAENEIRNALQKEKQLNELKSRFIAMASHEFRTPLSTILSSVSLLAKYHTTEEQDKRDKHLERIRGNVRNLTGVLDDFLSISRLEEGKVIMRPSEVDLAAFCEEFAEDMGAVTRPGQVIRYAHTGDREVILDKHLLRNILSNLVSNAIKYSPEETVIQILTDVSADQLILTVRDQGIGIPEEDQHHLFELFFRAQNAVNIQGTGLGLNIVQRYVSLMQGVIAFESQPGKGTTFRVAIPRRYTTP